MSNYSFVLIERLDANSEDYSLHLDRTLDGSYINEGSIIGAVETSKTLVDLIAPASGYVFFRLTDKSSTVVPGDIVAVLSPKLLAKDAVETLFNEYTSQAISTPKISSNTRFSKKASELMSKLNLSEDLFARFTIVTEDVVLRVANEVNSSLDSTKPSIIRKKFDNKDLLLIGAGGTAVMIADLLKSTGYIPVGIIDNKVSNGSIVNGIEVVGSDLDLEDYFDKGIRNVVLSFTSITSLNKRLIQWGILKKIGFSFPVFIHKDSSVEKSAHLDEGTIVLAGGIVGSCASLSSINFVNTGAVISHEARVGVNNHFAPNCTIAGRVQIGSNNVFGMCSTVFMDLQIGSSNIIQNGANIFTSIDNHQVLK
jgi:sugar O-acyltransferase (sialic acid O-acetyltransferase NeuD family)